MSDLHLEPIDPELDALLASERSAIPAADALERVWTRVASTTAGPGNGSLPPPGSGGGAGWMSSHPFGTGVAIFALGGLAGAAIHASLQTPPSAQVVYVERAPPASSSAAALATIDAPSAMPATAASSISVPAPRPSVRAATSSSGSTLSAERALLDDARGALSSGDAARALSLLDQHAGRFPHGQLGEEREAMSIQALVTLGRADEARARAHQFRVTSPNSLFLPAIDASLSSIP